jgi:hypothetical protein
MWLKDWSRKTFLAAAALLLACQANAFAGGHCHSCCNPCPTLTGEFFGYYPTEWRPWPAVAAAVPSTAPAQPKPKGSETEEPIPPPMKDKPSNKAKPGDSGAWNQSSPYSPLPLAARR